MNGKIDSSNNYILITPCKNEGGNLPSLINSIAAQTVKPKVWVIVDDGSTDNTQEIIKAVKEKYEWMKSISLDAGVRDIGLHLSSVIKTGFDYAISYCEREKIEYKYVGNVDGDLTLEQTFFENLLKEFGANPRLGIASGGTKNIIGNKIVRAKVSITEPSGGHMLIRRECYEECLGAPLSYAWDSVLKAKARIKGWETRRFEKFIATEIRDVNSAEGYWKGYIVSGKKDYFLNLNPIHAILKSIKYVFKKPYYIGVIYILSYFKNAILRKEQINDNDVKKYFWNKWKEILNIRIVEK